MNYKENINGSPDKYIYIASFQVKSITYLLNFLQWLPVLKTQI